MNSPDPIIGYVDFVDGTRRPVYDDGQRQYVVNDEGERVHGVFMIPPDEPDLPVIVEGSDAQTA